MDDDQSPFRPPYMSFQTFWRFIEELRSKPLPPQIDRSLMGSKSGTDQASLTSTLASFGLIGQNGTVTAELKAVVQGDEEGRRQVLAALIRNHYPEAIQVSESSGTEQQLAEVFRDHFGITSAETRRKSMTFFLHAAREAGIELSSHFPSTRSGPGAQPRMQQRRPYRRRASTAAATERVPAVPRATTPDTSQGDAYEVKLASGGSVSIRVSVNLFDLTADDRNFVIGLVDTLRGYSTGVASTGQSSQERSEQ